MKKIAKFVVFIPTILSMFLYINFIYANESSSLSAQPTVQNFITSMVKNYQFDINNLTNLLNSAIILDNVLANIQHPYEEQPWYIYRKHLVNDKRITNGLQYWENHKNALNYAEKRFGVPANIIVAIVGIESFYGRIPLKYPVLDSLVTLSFAYPPRANFFQKELAQYLLLTRDLNVDPRSFYGSYAGAIGLPQFMPSSYRKYAISYQDLIKRQHDQINLGNLTQDTDDVIVSIANFLQHSGWKKNQSIAVSAQIQGDKYKQILANKNISKLTIEQFKQYGITPVHKTNKRQTAKLIQLQNENDYEYWLGLDNFTALSRYNGDKQYIMSVYQLAIALNVPSKFREKERKIAD